MYILVRHSDSIIVGSAIRPVDEKTASANGYRVFEIENSEFKVEMIGTKLKDFVEVE